MDEAAALEPLPEAVALATANAAGRPSLRMVLLRGIEHDGLRFYTCYDSRKAHELDENPRAALLFHWKSLERQIRVEGPVTRASAADSDAYWATRPRASRLSAAVSPQSRKIQSLDELAREWDALERRLGGSEVPRPSNWGGFVLLPESVELWRSGVDRLHDRRLYERTPAGGWAVSILAP
jgi:pyridoxamine 5'-phosphate oxidase